MSNVDMASADAKPKRVVRRFEGWALALALASAGAVVGFAISESRLVVIVADLNTAHREETQRLIESYGGRVSTAASDVAAAAAAVSGAAADVAAAAATAASAADTSQGAAKTAQAAAVTVSRRKPVSVPITVSQAPPPLTPRELGKVVEQANLRAKEAK